MREGGREGAAVVVVVLREAAALSKPRVPSRHRDGVGPAPGFLQTLKLII